MSFNKIAIKKNKTTVVEIFQPVFEKKIELPLFSATVSAGFPSPADDFIDKKLDLNEHLIRHPSATFFVRAAGNSMIDAGIHDGDILIVDRAEEPADKKVIIALIDGELTVKRIQKIKNKSYLMPENKSFEPIEINEEMQFEVWGVVKFVIHEL